MVGTACCRRSMVSIFLLYPANEKKMNDKDFWISLGVFLLVCYLVVSTVVWAVRADNGDCKLRYVDFVFPISRLHCEVGK